MTSLRANLGARIDEEFEGGVGADHRADIASVEDGTTGLRSEASLVVHQGFTHLGHGGGGLPGVITHKCRI